MSGHGIPSNYAGATRLDADANAVLALTRAMWFGLSKAQRRALEQSFAVPGGRMLHTSAGTQTKRALVHRGMAVHLRGQLTGLGIAVREAGIYTRENPS